MSERASGRAIAGPEGELATTVSAEPRPVTPVGILAATLGRVRAGLADAGRSTPGCRRARARRARWRPGSSPTWSVARRRSRRRSPRSPAAPRRSTGRPRRLRRGRRARARRCSPGTSRGGSWRCWCGCSAPGRCWRSACSPATRRWRWPRRCPPTGAWSPASSTPRSPRSPAWASPRSPAGEKIEVRVGPAAATLGELAAAGEASTSSSSTPTRPATSATSTRCWSGGLLAPGGLICVDNTLLQGEAYLPRVALGERRRDRRLQRGDRRRPAGRTGAGAAARRDHPDPPRRIAAASRADAAEGDVRRG